MLERIEEVKNLIKLGKTQKAISKLSELLRRDDRLDEVILQSARKHNLDRELRKGTINIDKKFLEENKINKALLEIVKDIEQFEVAKEDEIRKKRKKLVGLILISLGFVTIYSLFSIPTQLAAIGISGLLGLGTLVVIFERITRLSDSNLIVPAKVLLWLFLILFICTTTLTFSSIWFKYPIDMQYLLTIDNDKKRVTDINTSTKNATFLDSIPQVQDMSVLEYPDNEGFELIEDSRTIDLRGTKENPDKPIIWNRWIRAKKIKDNDEFIIASLAGDIKFSSKDKIKKILFHYGQNVTRTITKKVYHVYMDVSDVDVGDEFSLNLNNLYTGTFFNPGNEDCSQDECVDMKMYGEFQKISLRVLFDYDNFPENMNRVIGHYVNEKKSIDPYLESNIYSYDLISSKEKFKILLWEVTEKPEFPAVYRLKWDWQKK